jgi:hypothetical protein
MEAMIFVGIQASGKSTFVRISLKLLGTRRRERSLLDWCLDYQQPFTVDNTNPTAAERAIYIAPAKAAGFRVVGYVFVSDVPASIRRNEDRSGAARVPPAAIGGTKRRLELPTLSEGFHALHLVRIGDDGRFVVEAWRETI